MGCRQDHAADSLPRVLRLLDLTHDPAGPVGSARLVVLLPWVIDGIVEEKRPAELLQANGIFPDGPELAEAPLQVRHRVIPALRFRIGGAELGGNLASEAVDALGSFLRTFCKFLRGG